MSSDLSQFHKKFISEATNFVKSEENCVNNTVTKFDKKVLIGLWWDAKGFWKVSDKESVLESMKVYRQINEGILECIDSAANDDANAYHKIIDLYKTIEKLKTVAGNHAEGKSKALCNLAKNFLDNHMKLDHHLKRVQNLVLEKKVRKWEKKGSERKKTFDEGLKKLNTFLEDKQKLENSVENLKRENQNFKDQMEKLKKHNKDLLNSIQETNATSDRRISEMREMNKRDVEEMVKKVLNEKFRSN